MTFLTRAAPARFEHARTVLQEMHKQAQGNPVWEGQFTKLVAQCGFSLPYYSQIRTLLMESGAIRQLKRGGGGQPSQWRLVKSPEELTDEYLSGLAKDRPSKDDASPSTQQQLRDISQRLATLERKMEVLINNDDL